VVFKGTPGWSVVLSAVRTSHIGDQNFLVGKVEDVGPATGPYSSQTMWLAPDQLAQVVEFKDVEQARKVYRVIAKKDAAAPEKHHPSELPAPADNARKAGDKAVEAGVYQTGQRSMLIPFVVSEAHRDEVKQVYLYASTDLGKTWERIGKADPDEKTVSFTAPRDGLYWFSTQLLYKDGRHEPSDAKDLTPLMKVRIITSAGDDKSSN
jgi:hypothetical protein